MTEEGVVHDSLRTLHTDYALEDTEVLEDFIDLEPADPDENWRYHCLMPGINTIGSSPE